MPQNAMATQADEAAAVTLKSGQDATRGRIEIEGGQARGQVDGEQDSPGARLMLSLPRFSLHRIGEEQAHVEGPPA
ncbi:MAG: hypothetical protein RI841_01260 [Halomonas sp.]|uniref:hypothetical protein n=1 Tax=Halomonas sp. TaxID=1486246 RepID=UPI00286FFFB7|nr:hypothetical protein [Halomonas sp.]MDR9438122.1 hypothetical protein [Halomonas sp.]